MRAAPTNSQTQQRKRGQSWQTELGPHFLWWWSQVDEGLGVGKEAQLKGGEPEPKGIQDCDTEVDGRLAQKVGGQVKSQPSFQPWEIGPVSMMSCTQFFPGHLMEEIDYIKGGNLLSWVAGFHVMPSFSKR